MINMNNRTNASYRGPALALLALASTGAMAGHNPIPTSIMQGTIRIELESIATGLAGPNHLTHAGDGTDRLFFTEQSGTVRLIENGVLSATPFLDVSSRLPTDFGNPFPTFDFDERGLLGAAFHPEFASNGKFYTFTSEVIDGPADFSVTLPFGESFNHQSVVAQWTTTTGNGNSNSINELSRRELLRIDNPQFNHNGGMINFGHDDQLYIAVGDGGNADDVGPGHSFPQGNGQDRTNVLGSFLRIDVDGSNSANGQYGIPSDNPFIAPEADPGDEFADEIYAYGFRNPFRFNFDTQTGDLIAGDVGQGEIEEVDLVVSGGNFGWSLKEGSFRFDPNTGEVFEDVGGVLTDGLIDPVLEYDHDDGISVIGGFVYRGSAIPELFGKYVFGEFTNGGFFVPGGRLLYGDLDTGLIQEFIIGLDDRAFGQFVNGLGIDADGELYVLATRDLGPIVAGALSTGGQIFKLVAAPVPLPAAVWLFGSVRLSACLGG
ncbi:MAG: glucose/arabinose dehydrogenase [Gammaproteobacteria bacterium]|jgi:glucose/arabinose dehydrogenase